MKKFSKAPPPIRLLIVDEDMILSKSLAKFLRQQGFQCRVATKYKGLKSQLKTWQPRFVLANLLFPHFGGFSLIEHIQKHKAQFRGPIDVIITSGHSDFKNVDQALKLGALDYILKPVDHQGLLHRLVFHLRSKKTSSLVSVDNLLQAQESAKVMHLIQLVLKQALSPTDLREKLYNIMRMVSLKVSGVRCSLIQHIREDFGYVVSSNDNYDASGITLNLSKYPEVLHSFSNQRLVAIENIQETSSLSFVKQNIKDFAFNSLIVCPVSFQGKAFGVLSVRMPPKRKSIKKNEIRFVEVVAQILTLLLNGQSRRSSEQFWLPQNRKKLLKLAS